ncbi:VOC family protein [Pseudonocardia sp.]|uniref:VOC family protein n=1 Tax=Pseudonocardia sp. TaxID=60912 RepID=UPI003D0D7974
MNARLDAIGVVVSDMAKALDFYRLLELEVPPDAAGAPHVEVALPGGLRLMFDTEATIRSFHPGWEPPAAGGRVHLAFLFPDAAGVDAAYAAVVGAGHAGELPPFDAPWGQRYAVVRDPDGNGVDLFAAL